MDMDINRDKDDNFILKVPLATIEFFFSSLGAVTTTVICLICGFVFDLRRRSQGSSLWTSWEPLGLVRKL